MVQVVLFPLSNTTTLVAAILYTVSFSDDTWTSWFVNAVLQKHVALI